jgi:preprotein translocase subunit SecA
MAEWARGKFGIEVSGEDLSGDAEAATRLLTERVRSAYARREIEYPVEYALEMTVAQAGMDNAYAVAALVDWANRKFEAALTPETLRDVKITDLHDRLVKLSEEWFAGPKLQEAIRRAMGTAPDVPAAIEFAKTRFDTELRPEDFDGSTSLTAGGSVDRAGSSNRVGRAYLPDTKPSAGSGSRAGMPDLQVAGDVTGKLAEVGRQFLRREMTELERFVLLQIFVGAWVDHLLAMDHRRGGIGLRGFAERDPKVAFKLEGTKLFEEMTVGVREKVTDMIFKVRLRAGEQMTSAYRVSRMVHEQLSGYDHLTQDMSAVANQPQKVATIIREAPRVGRNDPCPCGSGKKYKKCHGKGQ